MQKINLGPKGFVYPMPMALVGAMVNEKPNFLAVAWVSRVNMNPPIMAIALGRSGYTLSGIEKSRAFSINFPGADLIEETDYCGIYSGEEKDKSGLFRVFYGDLKTAPMITECPVTLECTLVNKIELPTSNLYLGEVVSTYSEERYMTGGKADLSKMHPFVFSQRDNNYWRVGHHIGKAWEIGKVLK